MSFRIVRIQTVYVQKRKISKSALMRAATIAERRFIVSKLDFVGGDSIVSFTIGMAPASEVHQSIWALYLEVSLVIVLFVRST